jgi:hypothetical protein
MDLSKHFIVLEYANGHQVRRWAEKVTFSHYAKKNHRERFVKALILEDTPLEVIKSIHYAVDPRTRYLGNNETEIVDLYTLMQVPFMGYGEWVE